MALRCLLLSFALVGCATSGASLTPSAEGPPRQVEGTRVRVLGIAQDGGLPHAACSCDRCELARRDPRRASPVASLAILSADHVWLIDASPDLPAQLDALAEVRSPPRGKVDRHPVDGVLLTHAHMGHYLGLAWLGFEAIAAEPTPVWASSRMAEFLRTHAPWEQLVRQRNVIVHEAIDEQAFELDAEARIEARPLSVPHRAEYTDTLGWRITGPRATVLYIPDTDPWAKWTRSVDEVLADVALLLIDGTFHSATELPGRDVTQIGHPLIVDTMDRLQARVDAGKIEVWFVHINHSNPVLDLDGPERRELERRGFRVAAVGDEFGI